MERPPPAPSNVPPGKRILIVIPVYNERENIVGLLDQLLAIPPALDVLLIEDNSPDGTGALSSSLLLSFRTGNKAGF